MSELKTEFLNKTAALGLAVYPESVEKTGGMVCAVVRKGDEKKLAVLGECGFFGEERNGP